MANKGLLYGGTKQMKMLKKLLAVVLTGAMALTLLTACGGTAMTDKDVADAMNYVAKVRNKDVTFTPRAEERELARKLAALYESTPENAEVKEEECKNILECKEGGANENNFVWWGATVTDEFGVNDDFMGDVFRTESAENGTKLTGNKKTPAKIRYMGTALCKVTEEGKPLTARVIVVTAEPVDEPAD